MKRKPVGEDLHVQQHDVDVVEEVEIDVRDVKRTWYIARRRGEPDPRDVVAAEHPHRRADRLGYLSAAPPLSVQEALHVGQKGDKLAVVPLFEEAGSPVNSSTTSCHGLSAACCWSSSQCFSICALRPDRA